MKKLITYLEPYFDPYTHKYDHSNMSEHTVKVSSEAEYDATMAAIAKPEREIPQDSIRVSDAPPTVDELKAKLEATDYKIIKCSEYALAGLPAPYDIAELHNTRQDLRNRINELEDA